jgi:hypothetical protein
MNEPDDPPATLAPAVENLDKDDAGANTTLAPVAEPLNVSPTVLPDVVTTLEESPVIIAVTSNDSDPNGDPIGLELLSPPAHGIVRALGPLVEYAPEPDFNGVDLSATAVATASSPRT